MNDSELARKDHERLLLLKTIYEKTQGDEHGYVELPYLVAKTLLSEDEIRTTMAYLYGEGLAKWSGAEIAQIMHDGVVEYERALRLPQKDTEHFPAAVINNVFNGPVGAFQTGASSIANVQQNIDSTAPEIALLLQQLRAGVDAIPDPTQKSEALELVHDVEKECGKAKPNSMKLKSFLATLSTIATIAGTVEKIAALFGH